MRLLSVIVAAAVAIVLTGCGPVYQTHYEYKPPVSSSGKMCITQCLQNKNTCQQMCSMRNDSCRAQAKQNAVYQFEIYKQQQEKDHKPVTKTVNSFDDSWSCDKNCDCDSSFNICYSSCGGQVTEKTVCVRNCDKQ